MRLAREIEAGAMGKRKAVTWGELPKNKKRRGRSGWTKRVIDFVNAGKKREAIRQKKTPKFAFWLLGDTRPTHTVVAHETKHMVMPTTHVWSMWSIKISMRCVLVGYGSYSTYAW